MSGTRQFTNSCSMCGRVFSASAPQALGVRSAPCASRPAPAPARCELRRERRARGRAPARAPGSRNTRPEANCVARARCPASAATRAQEFFGTFQQQAAAVAGLAVGGDGAAMGQAVERGDGGAHQPMARLVVEIGDQAEPAAVALVGVFVESRVRACMAMASMYSGTRQRLARWQSPPQAQGLTAIQALKEIRRTVRSANEQPRPDGGGARSPSIDCLTPSLCVR